MSFNKSETWKWKNWEISWSLSKEYTSEKNNSKYDVIIGPLKNTEANNLVSYFISKGYKETEILID